MGEGGGCDRTLAPPCLRACLPRSFYHLPRSFHHLPRSFHPLPRSFHPLPRSFHPYHKHFIPYHNHFTPSTFKAAPAGLVIKQTLLVLRSALLEVSCKLSSPSRRSGASPDIVTTICKKTSKTEHAHCNGTVPSAPAPEGEGPNNEKKDDVTRKLVDKDQIIGGGRTWRHWLKEPGFYKVSQFLCQGAQFRLILQCDYEWGFSYYVC